MYDAFYLLRKPFALSAAVAVVTVAAIWTVAGFSLTKTRSGRLEALWGDEGDPDRYHHRAGKGDGID